VSSCRYAWKQQEKVKQVYTDLTEGGRYEVWLDIHDMSKSGAGKGILEAMSEGIDNADVMLICVSKEYSASANCRLEAEYAHMHGMPILYLMMQEGYEKPTGWLGMLLGQKLWYNMFAGETETQMTNLLAAIKPHHTRGLGRHAAGNHVEVVKEGTQQGEEGEAVVDEGDDAKSCLRLKLQEPASLAISGLPVDMLVPAPC
jgi:hypothetical protein